jgi:hypothetical protein
VIISEDHTSSICRVEVLRVSLQAGYRVYKLAARVSQTHGRWRGDGARSEPARRLNSTHYINVPLIPSSPKWSLPSFFQLKFVRVSYLSHKFYVHLTLLYFNKEEHQGMVILTLPQQRT